MMIGGNGIAAMHRNGAPLSTRWITVEVRPPVMLRECLRDRRDGDAVGARAGVATARDACRPAQRFPDERTPRELDAIAAVPRMHPGRGTECDRVLLREQPDRHAHDVLDALRRIA